MTRDARPPIARLRHWLLRFEGAPASFVRYALKARPRDLPLAARTVAWHLRRGRYLFVLAHPRSGSSLLAHILQTNPEIAGIGETHRRYRNPLDLLALAGEVSLARGLTRPPTWFMEKALRERQVSGRVLALPRVRVILLTRSPGPTMRSMLDDLPGLFGARGGAPVEVGHARAARRLVATYDELAVHAEALGERAFALDYDDLVGAPDATLAALTRWLGLREPLTASYRVDEFTTQRGRGDPTPAIRRGRVDASIPPSARALDPSWLAVAERHYAALRELVARVSTTAR